MLRENNLYVYLLILVFINLRSITIQGIYIKVTSFNIYPNFWYIYIYIYIFILLVYFRNRHLKIFLHVSSPCPFLNTDHVLEKKVSLIVFRQIFYQNLSCCPHFQCSNRDLFEKFDWKLLFENCLFFFIFNFTYCKFFALGGGGFPASLKVWTFPSCWIQFSHIGNPTYWEKGIYLY